MTYEEVKAIRNNPTAAACDIKELQRLIDEAVEKQIPKKPTEIRGSRDCRLWENGIMEGNCPECGETVTENWFGCYCGHCGQALDWEEAYK
jgi:patatin-like phospholipase/acyl hydrolase